MRMKHWQKRFWVCVRRKGCAAFCIPELRLRANWDADRIHLSIPALGAMSEAERIRLQRDFAEISVSCHSLEDVKLAGKNGATQIILGTIFETECKKGLKGKGLGFVEAICKSCPLPVYAIGGISLERLPQVRKAGAAGGCMMSGFMKL